MKNLSLKVGPPWPVAFGLLAIVFLFGPLPSDAQTNNGLQFSLSPLNSSTQAHTGGNGAPPSSAIPIPSGTILPVVLRTPVSFEKCKAGQVLRGKIAQDVPLPNGSKIRKDSTILGHVAEVAPGANGAGTRVTIQFDKLDLEGQWVSIVTDLRAIAGFMTVIEAGIPEEAPNEGTPYNWLHTTQIGGDSVYGVRGPVMSSEDTSEIIGRSTGDGVLAQVSAKEGSNCRGAIDGNNAPQALWVFSGDACGTYGIEHLKIDHAGRTDPKGMIVLASQTRKVELRNGDGLLLRVD